LNYSELSPEELFRACAQTGEAAAWEEFVRRFGRLIARVTLRTAREWGDATPEVMDELAQDTYLKLCEQDRRLLRIFNPRHEGAVYGYLKVVTQNLVRDHFRGLHAQKRGAGAEEASLDAGAESLLDARPQRDGPEAADRQVLLGEIDVHVRQIVAGPHAARDRRIFWLYYRTGWTAKAIAALPGMDLTTKGVESAILRIKEELVRSVGAAAGRGRGE
jgi:RNA polymerase sigma-70 factor, ECF subfamily